MMKQIKNRFTKEIMCEGMSLQEVLDAHRKWLNKEGGGKRANLRDADLHGAKHIVSFTGVGGLRRYGYAVRHEKCVMVKLGCFWGTEKEAFKAIGKKYGKRSAYGQIVKAACRVVKEHE